MKNKKGLIGLVIFTLIFLFLLIWVYSLFLNKGYSIDYPYNIEQQKIGGWYKLWLKDDHTTVYCFDDERFISIIETAKESESKIKVEYQEYILRGFLCSSGSDNINAVVITNIIIENGIN